MAFKGYKQNPLYKSMTEAAYGLAKTLPSRSKKAVDVNRFKGIPAAVSKAGVAPTAATPASLKGLGTMTVPYKGSTRYEPGGKHMGVDIGAPKGTPIPAFTGGVVTDIRTGQGWTPETPSWGNYAVITTPTGEQVRYSHLNKSYVKLGAQVSPGQTIATVGGTGSTYSQHRPGPGYHLDLRIKDIYGKYMDPLIYLQQFKNK